MTDTKKAYAVIEQDNGSGYVVLGAVMCVGDMSPALHAERVHDELMDKGRVSVIDLNQSYTFIVVNSASGPTKVRPLDFDRLSVNEASDLFKELVS